MYKRKNKQRGEKKPNLTLTLARLPSPSSPHQCHETQVLRRIHSFMAPVIHLMNRILIDFSSSAVMAFPFAICLLFSRVSSPPFLIDLCVRTLTWESVLQFIFTFHYDVWMLSRYREQHMCYMWYMWSYIILCLISNVYFSVYVCERGRGVNLRITE